MLVGNVKIDTNVALAPMAGVTDLPYRLLAKEMGCGYLVTEMVSAKAILYNNKNTDELMVMDKSEHPIAIQLFGSDPDIMAEMSMKVAEEKKPDIIDVNMGCPVPKVVNNGEGSSLMKNSKLVEEIVTAMAKKCPIPVTFKIRTGFDDTCINAPEIAHIIEECGGAAVAVHGRTRAQYYSGKADWSVIKAVKDRVSIPVWGNGDVVSGESAKRMLEETGCDGVMIGRAARGNPWLFKEIKTYLETGEVISKPSYDEICDMIIKHATSLCNYKGEFTGIREMRKHFAWYTAGIKHAAYLRNEANHVTSLNAMIELVEKMRKEIIA